MYHIWECAPTQQDDPAVTNTSAAKRRTTTIRACEPCRKRKIRCNGEHPCETCQWYKKASSCNYTAPRQREMPAKRSLERAGEILQDYRQVLQRLFPAVHPDELKDLPREALIELLAKTTPSFALSPPSPITPGLDERPPIHPDAAHLEHFQPIPEEHAESAESGSSRLKGITDDVNALSLTIRKSTSYLGISSVTAILRVIVWLDPEAQTYFARSTNRSSTSSLSTLYKDEANDTTKPFTPTTRNAKSSPWDEIPLINAYFNYIHPFVPIVDEQDFRDTYMTRSRHDSRWLLLLNTVLALGSIANSSHCDEQNHVTYWHNAKQHLDIETLGSASIETVQALALLSGLYLHYISEPNLANSLMGVALRLAVTLGLHRDYTEGLDPKRRNSNNNSVDLRRRIWWSIFVLDAWVGYALGRPSMGRMSHAISAKLPQEAINPTPQILTLMQENVRFCMISTRMEDALAQSPIILEVDRQALDASFVEWFHASSVQNSTPRAHPGETHGVSVAKNVMRWRYILCRVLLHRPVLLWAAMRRTPFAQLPEEKRFAVGICRETTFELITDIATTWQVSRPSAISGWNATWLLYQALMTPLLCLFADRSDTEWNEKNCFLVETGLAALTDLRAWSQTAARSYEAIARIYEASKRHTMSSTLQVEKGKMAEPASAAYNTLSEPQHVAGPLDFTLSGSPNQEMYMNDVFDSLNWSDNWVDENFPYTQTSFLYNQDIVGSVIPDINYDAAMQGSIHNTDMGHSTDAQTQHNEARHHAESQFQSEYF